MDAELSFKYNKTGISGYACFWKIFLIQKQRLLNVTTKKKRPIDTQILTYMNHAGINGRKETTDINSNLFRFMEVLRFLFDTHLDIQVSKKAIMILIINWCPMK